MPTSRTFVRSSLAVLSFAVPFAWVVSARADVTCGTKTCPQNYGCVSEPVPCPDIACAPGEACPPSDCSGTTEECAPLPCSSDADCADGMVCYSQTQENCPSAPPCAKGEDCATPADTACTTQTISACVPKYVLPCEADADCGVGFTCETEQECACGGSVGSSGSGSASSGSAGAASGGSASSGSGSGGQSGSGGVPTPAAGSGSADPVPPTPGSTPDGGAASPPDCTCTPSSSKVCNLKVVACSVDQGCPTGWTCGDNPNRACSSSSDGTTSCSGDPAKICLPPYMDVALGVGHASDASGSAGTGNSPGTPPSGNPEPPKNAEQDTGSSSSSGTSAPASESDAGGGGCSVGHPRGTFGGMLAFAALAFAGVAGARRRRKP